MIQYQHFLGTWKNTLGQKTKGVESFTLLERDQKLYIQVTGIEGGKIPGKWEACLCKPYLKDYNATIPLAFRAVYQSDIFDAHMFFNENKNLLVLAMAVDYKNAPVDAGIFIREFFSTY